MRRLDGLMALALTAACGATSTPAAVDPPRGDAGPEAALTLAFSSGMQGDIEPCG